MNNYIKNKIKIYFYAVLFLLIAIINTSNLLCTNVVCARSITQKTTKRKFTEEEDRKVKELVEKYGAKNWKTIAQYLPTRNARQIRDRYVNYLSPNIIQNFPWTKNEDILLFQKHAELGPKWSKISLFFIGRNGMHIKNRFNKIKNKNEKFLKTTQKNRNTSSFSLVKKPNSFFIFPNKNNEESFEKSTNDLVKEKIPSISCIMKEFHLPFDIGLDIKSDIINY